MIGLYRELDLFLPVVEPLRGPNAVEPPAEALQMLLADAITVTSSITSVIGRTISLDRQDKTPRLIGMLYGEIEPVATHTVLGNKHQTLSSQGIVDVLFKGIHWLAFKPQVSKVISAAAGETK
nr:hypothetical protein [Cyanobium sp. NIES-981]